ncbi:MAG: Gfo/Idh/MocA family protein [Anaerolineae bacterium]|jgi:predicted dehydrogenase|nr:Gfo/Idh/MocA family oxidoreductase [Chloroflexota bacterium]
MSDRVVRVGVVGVGGIARHYHVPSYLTNPAFQIVAACDVSQSALEAFQLLVDTVSYTNVDYETFFREAEVDLVSVCTSNDMHHDVVMAAIEQGVDVYCEKPLALTYSQAQEMASAARERGIRTGVNFSHRRTPASQLVKEILDSGALGDLYHVSALYAAGSPTYAQAPGTWRNVRERAGFGGLGDMGSHMLDMVNWWLGSPVTRVAATMKTFVRERVDRATGEPMQVTTEDEGLVLLEYGNGALGHLCGGYTFTGRGYDQRAEIYGTRGGLMYDQQHAYQLKVHLPEEDLAQYTVVERGGTLDNPYTTILVPERLQGARPGQTPSRRTVLMDFMDAYLAEGPFAFDPGFEAGLAVQEVLEAVRIGDDGRRWVDLPLS